MSAPNCSIVRLRAFLYSVMVMWLSSDNPNAKSIAAVRVFLGDPEQWGSYYPDMANPPLHDWFLKAWMKTTLVTQAHLVRETPYSKATISDLVSGKQRFNRDILNDLALAMNVRPYELLIHPDEAIAIRRVRESALRIAAEATRERSGEEDAARGFG